MNAITFKAAAQANINTLLTLMREYYDYDSHTFEDSKLRRVLGDLLANPAFGYAWLIMDGESGVGYMVVCFGYRLK